MSLEPFRDKHKGETMLLVGNSSNLLLTPPELFDYPSIGTNTIHLYKGWSPSYYIAVDRRVEREFGKFILRKYLDIPKIIPDRMGRDWMGEGFYRWKHEPGPLWDTKHGRLWQEDIGTTPITYGNIMHVALKLAHFMGAKTILIIGMEHDPEHIKRHFWTDEDHGMGSIPIREWLEGYRQMREGIEAKGGRVLNISENTFVPEEILPRDDWHNWATREVIKEISNGRTRKI